MTPHPSPQTCIAEAEHARAQSLHFAALIQRSAQITSEEAIARRRRYWLRALFWRADAEKWERAADAVQQMRGAV